MANSQFDNYSFNPDLFLNSNETDLLIAALNSNKSDQNNSKDQNGIVKKTTSAQQSSKEGKNSMPSSDQSAMPAFNTSLQNHPYLDFDVTEGGWDWDLKGLPEHIDGVHVGALGGKESSGSEEGDDDDIALHEEEEHGDKRKNSDDPEGEEGGGKRQETDGKNGKKQSQRPGRKPLTSEPTTKRKAQNRAAQRAFRERKEKHLKELEEKVEELEKASETTNHENANLRAQVDRLQTELKEYRKRLSQSNLSGGSPTFGMGQSYSRSSYDMGNNFNFEFPKFGAPLNDNKRPTINSNGIVRNGSFKLANIASPDSIKSPNSAFADKDLNTLFGADVLASASNGTGNRFKSQPQRSSTSTSVGRKESTTSRANSTILNRNASDSNTASPASSGFIGFSSSCATTPESSADSPDQRKRSESGTAHSGGMDQGTFCKSFQTACGDKSNPVPPMMQSNEVSASTPALTNQSLDSSLDFNGLEWFANQNGGSFDPVLFADYREPQDSVMNADFGFFSDAFALPDLGSPQNQSQTQPLSTNLPKKKDLMQEIEDKQAGKEPEVVPGEDRQQFLTCNLLWDRVQRSTKIQSGEADMDDLCTQLKAKAKCSGSGAVISQSDVDAILGPPANQEKEPDFLKMFK